MTATILDTGVDESVLDEQDVEPNCTFYKDSARHQAPARWVVRFVVCCVPSGENGKRFHFLCDDCKDFVMDAKRRGTCRHCGTKFKPMSTCVVSIQPLNRGGGRG